MGMDNTFALTARITHVPFTPKASLRSALGCALLRFQRVLLAIFENSCAPLHLLQCNGRFDHRHCILICIRSERFGIDNLIVPQHAQEIAGRKNLEALQQARSLVHRDNYAATIGMLFPKGFKSAKMPKLNLFA